MLFQFIEKANSPDVCFGPRVFLRCPLEITEAREWFVKLWNEKIVPYMVQVAREGVKVLGRCGSFEDPTDFVCEHWFVFSFVTVQFNRTKHIT